MDVDRRQRNMQWDVLTEAGDFYSGSYGGSQLAVLMDIRDELQRLNSLLQCSNFVGIPATLKGLRRDFATARKERK